MGGWWSSREHFLNGGVYEGMFEQSMLLDSAPAKKAGALAVSLTAQTVAVGTLLLIPLIYTEHLPFAQLQLPTFLPLAPPPPEPPKAEPARTTRRIPTAPRVFTMPIKIPHLDTRPDEIGSEPQVDLATRFEAIAIPPLLNLPRVIQPPPPPPQVVEAPPGKPIAVTSELQAAKLIRKVTPVYPRIAIVARISGTVRLIGIVGKEGTVEQLQVVSGPPLLIQAAVDAVRQWVYRPTILGGKPVEVAAPIDVIFTLSQ